MLTFDRRKGTIFKADGSVLATGIWAGHNGHANKPEDEQLHGLGPLPSGIYSIAAPRDSDHLGPFVMDLTQIEGESYGRSLFRIHGDTVGDVTHEASDGCIIAGHAVRVEVWKEVQTDKRIKVV